tara:strand:+ start:53 stop:610 length:558 start_codon:yes stop_codon:yes gene_type:complete
MTNTKFFAHFVFFVIFCCIGGSAYAQTLEEKLEECSKSQVSLIRLQCYDRLTQEPTASQPTQTSRKKFKLRRKNNQATQEVREESVADESTEVVSQKIDQFGNERIAQADEEPDQITSRILGEFKGWSGYTKFQLENGQIWQQSNEGLLIVRINNPTVTIKKSFFGTYNFNVEGVNSSVKVRRIQ